ncbi:hypothetical protein SAMN02745121_08574 [Nannocystis exedens]|uniref:Transmembrane protein n=2 Tax=Nannocystis exedens TaxID=54 RepID=A0A1I2IAT9_9BACT|nr:hypothetical protein NAEX_06225 [Nannocystis exedens]SFF39405.1 hypothetical protein SAMN02745121_08574 [Nannocystis exedens]
MDFERRKWRLTAGLVFPGAALALAGGIVFLLARESPEPDGGPVCTVGKRCGNSCIAQEYECHEDGNLGPVTRAGWIAGTSLVLGGLGLIVAGILAPRRMTPRRVQCSSSGCTLVLRF